MYYENTDKWELSFSEVGGEGGQGIMSFQWRPDLKYPSFSYI